MAGVLVPSYSAALIYFLTSRSPVRPFDSLRELLQIHTYKLQTVAKTAHYLYFSVCFLRTHLYLNHCYFKLFYYFSSQNSTNPLLQKIYVELIQVIPEDKLPMSTEEAMEKVCKEQNLAHFGDMVNDMTYVSDINSRDSNCKIMFLKREISSTYSCWGLVRDSPYREVFNHL